MPSSRPSPYEPTAASLIEEFADLPPGGPISTWIQRHLGPGALVAFPAVFLSALAESIRLVLEAAGRMLSAPEALLLRFLDGYGLWLAIEITLVVVLVRLLARFDVRSHRRPRASRWRRFEVPSIVALAACALSSLVCVLVVTLASRSREVKIGLSVLEGFPEHVIAIEAFLASWALRRPRWLWRPPTPPPAPPS